MSRDELELMTDLRRVCTQASQIALEFMAGELSVDAEIAYAHRLVDVAEGLLRHANARNAVVIDAAIVEAEQAPPEPD